MDTSQGTPETVSASIASKLESERSRTGHGSEIIARKIIIRRDRWEQMLSLVRGLKVHRGIVATPAEVSAIVLDAGLSLVNTDGSLREPTQPNKPDKTTSLSERAGPVPTVHLNGTSGDSLLGRFKDAAQACRSLVSSLENTAPNARDYYPQGPDAFGQAQNAHRDRVKRVEALRQEMEHLALSVMNVIDERNAWKRTGINLPSQETL